MSMTFQLKDFDGPLDLLLSLINKAQINIKDIFVSEITDRYIEYVNNAEDLDMDDASDFIVMAATLLEIKSRSMLPKPPKLPEDEEDPEQTLIRRLEEYKKFREIAGIMQEFEHSSQNMFTKLPDEFPLPPQQFELKKMTLEELTEAFAGIMLKQSEEKLNQESNHYAPRDIHRDEHNVEECMLSIIKQLKAAMSIPFHQVFSDNPSREEVVTLFLAMLELLRLGEMHVEQDLIYGEIVLMKREPSDAVQEATFENDEENSNE